MLQSVTAKKSTTDGFVQTKFKGEATKTRSRLVCCFCQLLGKKKQLSHCFSRPAMQFRVQSFTYQPDKGDVIANEKVQSANE